MEIERRHFLRGLGGISCMAAGFASLGASPIDGADEPGRPVNPDFPIAIFGKVFQSHDYSQLADAIAQTGAEGVEATIRPGGHIDPDAAAQEVPKMVAALARRDKRVLIAATGVTDADSPSRKLLEVLRDNGIRHYRTGYYRYGSGSERLAQARSFAGRAKELAELNGELGMVGLYQNHAGPNYAGNLIWDLAIVLEGIPRSQMGIAMDLRHLRAEIGLSWKSAVDAVRPHIASVFAKSSHWTCDTPPKLVDGPLDAGYVDRETFVHVAKGLDPVPMSVHVEYFGQSAIPPDRIAKVIEAYRHDVGVLRSWMEPR